MAQLGLEPGKSIGATNPTRSGVGSGAHDHPDLGITNGARLLLRAPCAGIGYKVQAIDCPDNAAFRWARSPGNRGVQSDLFHVGNLVKY